MSTADLIDIWAREATAALMMRSEGKVELELYKVVAQREVSIPSISIISLFCFFVLNNNHLLFIRSTLPIGRVKI